MTRTQLSKLIQEQATRGVFLEQVLHSAPQKGVEISKHSQLWALVPMQQRPVIIEDHFSTEGEGGKPKTNAKKGIREQLDLLQSVLDKHIPDSSSAKGTMQHISQVITTTAELLADTDDDDTVASAITTMGRPLTGKPARGHTTDG